jgi:hypothetical protein
VRGAADLEAHFDLSARRVISAVCCDDGARLVPRGAEHSLRQGNSRRNVSLVKPERVSLAQRVSGNGTDPSGVLPALRFPKLYRC